MYSHYFNGSFSPIRPDQHTDTHAKKPTGSEASTTITGGLFRALKQIGDQFAGERLDSGDILLILIILLLYLEGDNLELVITLGLMLLLGLTNPSS